MIIVKDLHKAFQKPISAPTWKWQRARTEQIHAVSGVSFAAQNGSITGLLGANGAGKTTSLRMIGSLLKADRGTVEVDGISVQAQPQLAQSRMGVLSDARGLYPRLSARENIVYYGLLHGMPREAAEARASQIAEWLEMDNIIDRRTEGFSQGERMKTALARALVHDPQNIILDEPTNGLDVVATRALREFLRWLQSPAGGAKCIIFSTHIMQEVERLCDHVVIIANGRNVAEGNVPSLLQQAGQDDFEDAFVQLAFAEVAA